MILPDEDRHRFDAPPEPSSNERWDEPEDYCDYIDTFTDDEVDVVREMVLQDPPQRDYDED